MYASPIPASPFVEAEAEAAAIKIRRTNRMNESMEIISLQRVRRRHRSRSA